jgi:hypothetical protein
MVPASALLYGTSAHVRELQKELAGLTQQSAQEKEALRVLNAEWAYLNNPQRLASRAKAYLGFKTNTSAKQIARLDDLSTKIVLRTEMPLTPVMADNSPGIVIAHKEAPPVTAKLLAQPITYSARLVDDLPKNSNAKLPAAAAWSDKVVGMNSLSPESSRDRRMP